MQQWLHLVKKAQNGDLGAFDGLVRIFRDMALGYAYSILGDFNLAEDAAQEAFVRAFRDIKSLKEARALPAWLRKIVFKQCHRIFRKKRPQILPIEKIPELLTKENGPQEQLQKNETEKLVSSSIKGLPEKERTVTSLYYINGYSMQEIGTFLDVKVNTVKSHLYSARQKLQKRMVNMVEETLKENAPGEGFNRRICKILERVPVISFQLHQTKKKDGLRRCPESVPFASCVRAYLEYLGEELGYKKIRVYNLDWRLDTTFVYLMGTTGAAFRLTWKQGWELDNPAIFHLSLDPLEPHRRGLESLGHGYEILSKNDAADNEKYLRRRIIESIRAGRPVIAQGVVGPPEECLITGFDKNGDILLGWSYFQKVKEFSTDVEFEKSGYFRKFNWYQDTHHIMMIGKKEREPSLADTYYQALQWAIRVMDTPEVYPERYNGLAAFQAWADAIAQDEEFEGKKVKEIHHRYMVHHDALGSLAEGRWYAANFLGKVKEDIKTPDVLTKAAACFNNQHALMWQIWGLVGGPGYGVKKAKLFADKNIRQKTAEIILQARDKEEEAISHLKQVIKTWP